MKKVLEKVVKFLISDKFKFILNWIVAVTILSLIGITMMFVFAIALSLGNAWMGKDPYFDYQFYFDAYRFLGFSLLIEFVICGFKYFIDQIKE